MFSLVKQLNENMTWHGIRLHHSVSSSSVPRRAGHGPNKMSLRYDANVSVRLGEGDLEASLELLDLTVDPDTTTFDRALLDVFSPATPVLVFQDSSDTDSNFGRLGEVSGRRTFSLTRAESRELQFSNS